MEIHADSARSVAIADGRVVRVRVATGDDAAGVLAVRVETAREEIYTIAMVDEIDLDVARQAASIDRSAREPGWLFLVAECDGSIVGYLEFTNGGLRRTRHSGMFSIYLLEPWRAHGIGSALLDALVDWAVRSPLIEKITLAVFASNTRARALYERFGFVVEGWCPGDIRRGDGVYDDSVLMYLRVGAGDRIANNQ